MSAGDAGERSKIQRPVDLGWSVKNRPGRGGQQGEGGHHEEGTGLFAQGIHNSVERVLEENTRVPNVDKKRMAGMRIER